MAGRTEALSVSETTQLPAQPTTGVVEYIPLGGDGFTAPKFAYSIIGYDVDADASGGTLTAVLEMDPRYASLIGFVTGQLLQAVDADVEFLFSVSGLRVPTIVNQGDAVSSALSGSSIGITWRPEPIILPGGTAASQPRVQIRFPNVDTDVIRMHALVFCFDIRVREIWPMGPLLWARGN